jgi:hypothetical protein
VPVITVSLLQTKTTIIIIKTKLENMWKTHAKQFFFSKLLEYCFLEQFFTTPKYKFEKHKTKNTEQTSAQGN